MSSAAGLLFLFGWGVWVRRVADWAEKFRCCPYRPLGCWSCSLCTMMLASVGNGELRGTLASVRGAETEVEARRCRRVWVICNFFAERGARERACERDGGLWRAELLLAALLCCHFGQVGALPFCSWVPANVPSPSLASRPARLELETDGGHLRRRQVHKNNVL